MNVSHSMMNLPGWKMSCAVALFCGAIAGVASAQTFTTLITFDGTNGAYPEYGSLVQGTDGNFYGTTADGGADPTNVGTAFKMTPTGALTTLYSFCSQADCTDGKVLTAGLVLGTSGKFYGTTYYGGVPSSTCLGFYGCGTVFEITPAGKLTTLHSFVGTDGESPFSGLVQATNGDFYGTTIYGGTAEGTIYKITPAGTLTTLYNFCTQAGCPDGNYPYGTLVQAANGDFYGTTGGGGANEYGTVFKITLTGDLTTLHSFTGTDGENPEAGLVLAANGDFYGTTLEGGANEVGTVFKMTPTGTLTTLYSFCSETGCTDGELPYALMQAANGNFYGMTSAGGANRQGTVFEITPAGALTTLYSFCSQTGCADGEVPVAQLMQATSGDLYGTTYEGGGASSDGTVFSLSLGLSPFVKTLPTSGKVGTQVLILGNSLTGTTSVTFNGTAAQFTVVSATEIKVTVPTGATTGTVEVSMPGRTLSSNVKFRVT